MDIVAQDCRLEGTSSGYETTWVRGTHLPTGVSVTIPVPLGRGLAGKRALMKALQMAVDQYFDQW